MKRAVFGLIFAVGAASAVVGVGGCSSSTNGSPAASKPTPEKSFELILATFRRGVEDIPVGFVVRQGGGHSMMSGRKEVSHQLIPPSKKGEPYRATITVESEWKYSVQQSDEPDGPDREEESDQQHSPLNESANGNGLEILDPDLVASSGAENQSRSSGPANGERRVTRLPDEAVRTYELVYQNGRWSLVTELDPETEQSIERAFTKALDTQI